MKNKLMFYMVTVGAALLTFIAFATSVSACLMGSYQPEEPKALRS